MHAKYKETVSRYHALKRSSQFSSQSTQPNSSQTKPPKEEQSIRGQRLTHPLAPQMAPTIPMEVDVPPRDGSVGIYTGAGINNGSLVWRGPKDGLFIRNRNDNRISISNRNLLIINRDQLY